MKFSRVGACLLIGLTGLVLIGFHGHAQPVTPAMTPSDNKLCNKVIVYPAAAERIDQLKQRGFTQVKSYGSYWVVEATDAQVDELTKVYGARAVKDSRLNRIELGAASFDTTVGQPTVPAGFQQVDGPGKRLRLVQFRGRDGQRAVAEDLMGHYGQIGAVDPAAERHDAGTDVDKKVT